MSLIDSLALLLTDGVRAATAYDKSVAFMGAHASVTKRTQKKLAAQVQRQHKEELRRLAKELAGSRKQQKG